ncbi:MAG: helix-turn-helix domain-containing protein, partial [Silanimonas sp.]
VLALLGRRRKTDAELLFAVFCCSMAMAMLRPGLGDVPVAVTVLVTLGACATCNVYWLVARALFRGDGGVGRVHLAAAGGITALIVLYRAAEAAGAGAGMSVLGDLLTLASSTVLVLAFLEALRGWATLPRDERRLRVACMLVYGGCLVGGTAVGAVASANPEWATVHRVVVLGCSTAILVFSHVALRLRRRQPWPAVVAVATEASSGGRMASEEDLALAATHAVPEVRMASEEDLALAATLRDALERRALYREPELKVADLAAAVGSAEHKVSRAITLALRERNFNQWVNRYRIEHACRLLRAHPSRSVLEISFESGFASLGPFNRAFKAAMGCTPSAWRAEQRAVSA